ncbi:MAG: aspartyl protease family protein [Isosphaeraceae bacterium]
METETVGRVVVEARVENLGDLYEVEKGRLSVDQVRSHTIPDALVDTGATILSLPKGLIEKLGLRRVASRRVRSSTGLAEVGLFQAVRLTIQGRDCTMDVLEVPDGCPTLIGQLPLEHLDFVVDMRNHTLIGNPAHGGEHTYELY